MEPFSRRTVLAAAASAIADAGKRANTQSSWPLPCAHDPAVALARAGVVAVDERDARRRRWQHLEDELCRKAKPLGFRLQEAGRSELPEAREMRVIERQLETMSAQLDQLLEAVVETHAQSIEGALAKMELALRLQEPLDAEEPVWPLLESSFRELSKLV